MIYKIKNMCKSKFSTFRIPLFTILMGSLLAVSCSDFSDYNEVPESKLTSGTSLWQNIINQGNLNNFATLVQKSGMDIYLKGANYLTVLAPLDGTYDMQQYMNADSAKTTEQFVKQHIANYGNVITGDESSMLRTLNGKIHYLSPIGVTDSEGKEYVNFAAINLPASNGIMHLLQGQLPWKPNVYEYTYATDVVKYNDWDNIESAKKTAVNSSMAVDVAEKELTIETDYLNDSVYKYVMTYFLSYSMKDPHNKKWLDPEKSVTIADDDTIVTTNRQRVPGGAVAINDNSVDIDGAKVKKLSNGYACVIDELAFKSWDTYNPYMLYRSRQRIPYYHPTTSTVETKYLSKIELAERDTLFDDLRAAGKPFIDKVVIPQLFDKRFDSQMQYVKINSNSSTNPSFCVALRDALATTYRVIMVTAPPQVEEDYVNEIAKKQKFSFWIDYYDGTDHLVTAITPAKSEMQSNKFTYFDLGEITFPYSYAGLDAYPTLRVQCTNPSESGTGVKQYESVIRLAGVLLIPKEAVDFYGE